MRPCVYQAARPWLDWTGRSQGARLVPSPKVPSLPARHYLTLGGNQGFYCKDKSES